MKKIKQKKKKNTNIRQKRNKKKKRKNNPSNNHIINDKICQLLKIITINNHQLNISNINNYYILIFYILSILSQDLYFIQIIHNYNIYKRYLIDIGLLLNDDLLILYSLQILKNMISKMNEIISPILSKYNLIDILYTIINNKLNNYHILLEILSVLANLTNFNTIYVNKLKNYIQIYHLNNNDIIIEKKKKKMKSIEINGYERLFILISYDLFKYNHHYSHIYDLLNLFLAIMINCSEININYILNCKYSMIPINNSSNNNNNNNPYLSTTNSLLFNNNFKICTSSYEYIIYIFKLFYNQLQLDINRNDYNEGNIKMMISYRAIVSYSSVLLGLIICQSNKEIYPLIMKLLSNTNINQIINILNEFLILQNNTSMLTEQQLDTIIQIIEQLKVKNNVL